ncbi:MAG: hypothetical protein KF870_12000 [Leadbetterella sp.]|nr:hypothetical protein [Leadbetterella sp.]
MPAETGKYRGLVNKICERQFYLTYQKSATLSHKLSWSHYVELLKIENVVFTRSKRYWKTGMYETSTEIPALSARQGRIKENSF